MEEHRCTRNEALVHTIEQEHRVLVFMEEEPLRQGQAPTTCFTHSSRHQIQDRNPGMHIGGE